MKLILKTGLLAAMMFALVGSTAAQAAIYGGNLPINACNAGKAKCVIKMKSCTLGCWNKVIGKGGPVDTACLAKCRNGFLGDPAIGKGCTEKLDIKNGMAGCGASFGTGPVLKSKVEAHVNELVSSLAPVLPVAGNKCTAGKTKCVIKYNACVLGIVGKAFKAGGPIGSLDKCNAILTDNYLGNGKLSCIGKLEAKYNVTATPCQTAEDQGLLKTQDDAFVNDVIYNLVAGSVDMKTKRCVSNTFTQCTTDADCGGGPGDCQFFFGAPLPLAAGGIASCVTSQWNGGINGTFNTATGASAGTASVLSRVYTGGNSITNPCPVCQGGNDIPNDGLAQGTCSAGARAGLGCDSNGESPVPSFGKTSLDCPPPGGTLVGTIPIDLTNTNTGTVSATVDASSPTCNGSGGSCLCASCSGNSSIPCRNNGDCALAGAGTCTNIAGTPREPNACIDDTNGDDCAALPGGEGECTQGPVDNNCKIETFRSCAVDADCPASGDTCGTRNRECFAGYNGNIGDSITAQAAHGVPSNHTGTSTFASIFCIAPTGSAAVNNAAGLPGPGRLTLGGVASENGDGASCATVTEATFTPTSKGGVLDTGWTGLAHDAKVVGQGKVTISAVCAGVAPNCNCTYTGPIDN
jgi:hypothetical protein